MKLPISLPYVVTLALLSGTLLLNARFAHRIPEPLAVPLARISPEVHGWQAVRDDQLTAGVLRQLKPTDYLQRTYRKNGVDASVFAAFYEEQRAGESMHSPKHCLPGSGWEIWKHDQAAIPLGGEQLRINKYSIHNSGHRMLMFYWYQSRNRIVASEYMGKVLLARDTLMTGRTSGSIVRVMVPDQPGMEAEGLAISRELMREMQRCYGATGTPLTN